MHDVLSGERRNWPATEEGVTGSKESKMSTMSNERVAYLTPIVCAKFA